MDRRINKSILDEWMGNQMNRWMDIKLDGLIDRQTGDEQTARQTKKIQRRWIDKQMDIQVDMHIHRETNI